MRRRRPVLRRRRRGAAICEQFVDVQLPIGRAVAPGRRDIDSADLAAAGRAGRRRHGVVGVAARADGNLKAACRDRLVRPDASALRDGASDFARWAGWGGASRDLQAVPRVAGRNRGTRLRGAQRRRRDGGRRVRHYP